MAGEAVEFRKMEARVAEGKVAREFAVGEQ